MKKKDYYSIAEEKEKKIWDNGIFIFDTSALLDFYLFTDNVQDEIFKKIFSKIKDRLWITSHVEFEYLKNRKKGINNKLGKYTQIEDDEIQAIEKSIEKLKNQITAISDKTRKNDKHPYIDTKITKKVVDNFKKFETSSSNVLNMVTKEISKIKNEIEKSIDKDDVYNKFNSYFNVSSEYNYDKILSIIKEGELRFRNEIPPGYEDFVNQDKEGIQKFADLIIWHQIIDIAKTEKKDIIFISNDSTKNDWYLSKDNYLPKYDLRREIKDKANVEFLMYRLNDFVIKSDSYIDSKLKKEIISAVKEKEIIGKERITSLSELSNEELRRRVTYLSSQIRGLLYQYKIEQNKLIFYDYTAKDKVEMDRKWNERNLLMSNLSTKLMNDYSYFKGETIILRNEIISRLPKIQRERHVDFMYEHPTNPLGIEEVVGDLEKFALLLPISD